MRQPPAPQPTTTTTSSDSARHAAVAFLTLAPGIRPRHRVFPGNPDQVRHARHFARRYLSGCPAVHEAELLTSEIFTNSVRHSRSRDGGTIDVHIAHQCPGILRVAVTDDGATTAPELARASLRALTGRGLALVQDIATQWGHYGDGHTRTVWFELRCGAAP